jgi:acylphosphatase
MIRRRVRVTGKVQGVFFRDSCRREAKRRGVNGWVLNRADGSVEAVFEGAEDEVAAMVAWTRTGPPRATVQHVEVTAEPVQSERGFRQISTAP